MAFNFSKVNNGNTRTMFEIISMFKVNNKDTRMASLTLTAFIVNFNRFHTYFRCSIVDLTSMFTMLSVNLMLIVSTPFPSSFLNVSQNCSTNLLHHVIKFYQVFFYNIQQKAILIYVIHSTSYILKSV